MDPADPRGARPAPRRRHVLRGRLEHRPHPELIREIVAAGSEIGLHTFTHPDLTTVSARRLDLELTQTQLVIAGAAGVTSDLLRPPYSSTAAAIDDGDLPSSRRSAAGAT